MSIIYYSIFILSCSVNQPANCDKQYLGDIETPTPVGCLTGAQPLMRKWVEDHAGVRTFKLLRCVDSRRKGFEMGRDQA
jgi:hypothetical protein